MIRTALHRLADAIGVVLGVSLLVFLLLHAAPGSPLDALQGDPRLSPAVRAAWAATFDPAASLPRQFITFWQRLLAGDLGWSWSQQRPVQDVLRAVLPWSVLLMGSALLCSAVGGLLLGVWLALRRTSRAARVVSMLLRLLATVPDAWLALVLLAWLAVTWPIFPMQGVCDPRDCTFTTRAVLRHLALPVLALTLVTITRFARLQRAATIPALDAPLVRAAEGRGVPNGARLRRYVVRRTLLPWLAMVGLSVPSLIGGAVFIERVFGWPGAGTALLQAIGARDYALVLAIAMLAGLMTVGGALFTDLMTALLAPHVE